MLDYNKYYIHFNRTTNIIKIYDKKTYVRESVIMFGNNDINKIMGIGIIKNFLQTEKHYKIYNIGNYNRYTYKSKYRIDASEFTPSEIAIIGVMETLLFKGSTHFKRGHGIQRIPRWIVDNKAFDFTKFFVNMFKNHFISCDETIETIENNINS